MHIVALLLDPVAPENHSYSVLFDSRGSYVAAMLSGEIGSQRISLAQWKRSMLQALSLRRAFDRCLIQNSLNECGDKLSGVEIRRYEVLA